MRASSRVCIEDTPVGEKIELVRKKIGCLGIQNSAMQYGVELIRARARASYILRCKLRSGAAA